MASVVVPRCGVDLGWGARVSCVDRGVGVDFIGLGFAFGRLVCVLVYCPLYSDSCSVSLSGLPNLAVGVDPACGSVRCLAFLCVTHEKHAVSS